MHKFNSFSQLPISKTMLRNLNAHQAEAELAQQIWEAISPDTLFKISKATSIKHKTLNVVTSHNAVATKIKLLTPSLLKKLEAVDIEVTAIKVKVQVKSNAPAKPKPVKKVSDCAAKSLLNFTETLEDGDLKTILAKIAEKAAQKK